MTQIPGKNGNIAPGPLSNNLPQGGGGAGQKNGKGAGGGLLGGLGLRSLVLRGMGLRKRALNVNQDYVSNPLREMLESDSLPRGSR